MSRFGYEDKSVCFELVSDTITIDIDICVHSFFGTVIETVCAFKRKYFDVMYSAYTINITLESNHHL